MLILESCKPNTPFDDFALAKLTDARSEIEARMFVQPRPGTKAADLLPAEKMWLLRVAGVPMHCEMDGTMLSWVTSVPCGIADRGDGTYIVAMRQK